MQVCAEDAGEEGTVTCSIPGLSRRASRPRVKDEGRHGKFRLRKRLSPGQAGGGDKTTGTEDVGTSVQGGVMMVKVGRGLWTGLVSGGGVENNQ